MTKKSHHFQKCFTVTCLWDELMLFFHVWDLWSIQRYLSFDSAKLLAHALLSNHRSPSLKVRTDFKISLLTYQKLLWGGGEQPVYIFARYASHITRFPLIAITRGNYSVPRVKTNAGARVFHSFTPSHMEQSHTSDTDSAIEPGQ